MYINESIKTYINDLAARKPAPGGGSAAGLCGALGIALLEMVCNFTIGNEKYKGVEQQVRQHLGALKKFEENFKVSIDEDVKVYSEIRDAFRTKDKKIIDKALKSGYCICLKMCSFSKGAMEIALDLSEKGNVNLITDVGCGAELLNAAFNSSIFNCEINLKGMEDKIFRKNEKKALGVLTKEIEVLYRETVSKIHGRLQRTENRG